MRVIGYKLNIFLYFYSTKYLFIIKPLANQKTNTLLALVFCFLKKYI